LLAYHGVRARILNANASSLAGELPIESSLPQVWVDKDEDAPRARALIEAHVTARPGGPPRNCPACGEENPASFDLCWSCGAGLER